MRIDSAVNVVPERTSVTIEVSTEVEIVGTTVNDVSISSEVRVSVAVSVCVASVDTMLVESSMSVEI